MKYTPFLETVRTTLFSLNKHLETKEEQRRLNSSLTGKKHYEQCYSMLRTALLQITQLLDYRIRVPSPIFL